jgi:hypothetical protein
MKLLFNLKLIMFANFRPLAKFNNAAQVIPVLLNKKEPMSKNNTRMTNFGL